MAIGQGLRRPQNMSRLHSVVCIPVVCMHSTPSDGDRMPTAGFEQTRDPRANGVRSPDQRRGKETRLIAQHARSARTTAGIHLVTAEYDQQVDRRWQYQHSSSGLRSLRLRGCAFATSRAAPGKDQKTAVSVSSGLWRSGLWRPEPRQSSSNSNETKPWTARERLATASLPSQFICRCRPGVCASPGQRPPTDRESGRKLRCKRNPAPPCTGSSRVAYENPLRDSCCFPSQPGTLEFTKIGM